MSDKRRTRRIRRKANAIQKHGRSAGPKHTLRSGRTGIAHSKKTPGKKHGRRVTIAVVVPPFNWDIVMVRAFNSLPAGESAHQHASARAVSSTVAAHREGRSKGGTFTRRSK